MVTGYIYKVTNMVNGKVYIGQTIQSVKDRWYRHCQKKCLSDEERNMQIKRAIFKYGKENFKVETLEECSQSQLDERERYYISYFNSHKEGYNSTDGGQSGGRPLQVPEEYWKDIADLYEFGFSLRAIGREFGIDKRAVKKVLQRQGITIRSVRNYKMTSEIRSEIVNAASNGISRKEIMEKYKISASYLSQLISGNRRI